ncbi:uncharacterized protein PHACADRAFT_212925 [Phanerochaete carnosa HHB-10118-sp]|uniref:BTB domain-containing protein n=1 Tax=Phanerochaete carnosa (strain HHB-10118-sp) TaxID=650164 RepID=K5VIC4_PHACS|nr:uncharacterized protein PHACADRAFT_212925 [Phanerochaete carnosa HHB-10118-sp]EKM51023.1 hypothetical protein PHACADRAFT_212925 [Phanerochaete carnosa HHB-10118-sp]
MNSKAPSILPFSSPFADVILRSSEGTDFRMLKVDLIRSSPMFESMFSLPQPAKSRSSEDFKDGLPVVPLAETADVLDVLLRFCMPGTSPQLDDLRLICQVTEAAKKYDIETATHASREALNKCAQEDPVRVYAIACRLRLEREARLAARLTLHQPVWSTLSCEAEELNGIDGHEFRRLLKYQESCRDNVLKRVSAYSWVLSLPSPARFWERSCCGQRASYVDGTCQPRQVQTWWEQYMRKTIEKLRAKLDSAEVSSEDAFSLFLRDARCATCQVIAATHITTFIRKMASEVSGEISKVELEFVS